MLASGGNESPLFSPRCAISSTMSRAISSDVFMTRRRRRGVVVRNGTTSARVSRDTGSLPSFARAGPLVRDREFMVDPRFFGSDILYLGVRPPERSLAQLVALHHQL